MCDPQIKYNSLIALSFDHNSKVSPFNEICDHIGSSSKRKKVTSSNNSLRRRIIFYRTDLYWRKTHCTGYTLIFIHISLTFFFVRFVCNTIIFIIINILKISPLVFFLICVYIDYTSITNFEHLWKIWSKKLENYTSITNFVNICGKFGVKSLKNKT